MNPRTSADPPSLWRMLCAILTISLLGCFASVASANMTYIEHLGSKGSPAITSGTNQGFGGTVEVELGGLEPGFGDNNHDQINDTATIWLFDEPELEILPWNDFVPAVGDEFVVMTWQTDLEGTFGEVTTDPWFTGHDIAFDLHYHNTDGAGDLTLEAVPEPASMVSGLIGLGMIAGYLRRRLRHHDGGG